MLPLVLGVSGLALLALASSADAKSSGGVIGKPSASGGSSGGGSSPMGAGPVTSPMPIEPSGGAGDGLAWAQQLPAGPSAGREEAIFKAIERGDANIDWAELPVEGVVNGTVRRGKVYVFARTLRIGAQNPVRVSVNYETAQRICDLLGCAMMTPHVADLTFDQSTLKLAPQPMSKWVEDGSMAKTNRMIEYSQKLDKLVPIETPQLVSNESKHWVNTKRFWVDPDAAKRWPPSKRSANYGWWSKAAPNGRLWQSTGLAHDWFHVDYSQQLVLMSQRMELEGYGNVHVGSVLKFRDLCVLSSYDGPLASWAHPAFNKTSPDLEA